VEKDGQRKFLPLANGGKFNVFRNKWLSLSAGDQVRITRNFQSYAWRVRSVLGFILNLFASRI
jgi:hypothetical protein